jgi:hypothetical protein
MFGSVQKRAKHFFLVKNAGRALRKLTITNSIKASTTSKSLWLERLGLLSRNTIKLTKSSFFSKKNQALTRFFSSDYFLKLKNIKQE